MIVTPRSKVLSAIGVIVLCYGVGLVLGNLGLYDNAVGNLQKEILNIVVPLALPLVFFSMDISRFRSLARPAVFSFFAGIIAVIAGVSLATLLFPQAAGKETWKMAGMAIGVYTGGTPNLAAIGSALRIDQSNYVSVHTADVVVGAVYLFFLLSFAKKVFSWFLPPFKAEDADITIKAENYREDFRGFQKKHVLPLSFALLLTVLIVGISALIGFRFKGEVQTIIIILLITSVSVALSFNQKIRSIGYTYQSGFYLLAVFSLTVSSMADFNKIVHSAPQIFLFIGFVYVVSSTIHALLAALLKIDVDTYMITSVSFLYSPPFVPVIASRLKNPAIILTGILTGLVGWMVGNYLGITIAYLLK